MTNQVVYLHRFITQHFSLEELQMLCFDLGIEYEDLPGWSTRSAKSRELVLRVGEQSQLEALLEELRRNRPIPFNQAGLSTESSLVTSLYDDLDEYRELSKPFWDRWQQQLQLDVRRVFIFLVIILAGLIAGTGFLYISLRPDRPKKMSGEFNIAVAEFGQLAADGRVHASKEGAELSATIFTRVQREVENLPTDIVVEVWHNVMRPGVSLDFIPGSSGAERAAAAATLAERINADLIIYGNLDEDGNGFQFVPEFYVAELPNAGELVGAHGLGNEIAIRGPSNALGSTLQFNEKLAAPAANIDKHLSAPQAAVAAGDKGGFVFWGKPSSGADNCYHDRQIPTDNRLPGRPAVLVHPKCRPANPGGFPTHAHELGSLSAERLSVG